MRENYSTFWKFSLPIMQALLWLLWMQISKIIMQVLILLNNQIMLCWENFWELFQIQEAFAILEWIFKLIDLMCKKLDSLLRCLDSIYVNLVCNYFILFRKISRYDISHAHKLVKLCFYTKISFVWTGDFPFVL